SRNHERVRLALVVALVVVPVLAVGCDSSKKAESSPPPAGPWGSVRPPQVAEREPVTRFCRASDLKPPRQVKFVPRLQGGVALVPLRNVSRSECRLTGRPAVTLVKRGGPVQVNKPFPTTPVNFPETT